MTDSDFQASADAPLQDAEPVVKKSKKPEPVLFFVVKAPQGVTRKPSLKTLGLDGRSEDEVAGIVVSALSAQQAVETVANRMPPADEIVWYGAVSFVSGDFMPVRLVSVSRYQAS